MATIPWLADVLRADGIPVVEHGNWRNHMRPGSFDPIGVLWHHTAATSSPGNPHPGLSVVINGRPDLPGPLAQALVDYNGVFHVISAGRCNHAGRSGGSGPIPVGDGNTMLIGWEIDYDGVNQHMTAAQYNNSVKATAAVLRRLGRDASYARGHKETTTTGKIDPSFVNLDQMRADVAARLGGSLPRVAFQGHDTELYTAGDAGVKAWELWLAPNTSPSIAALTSGGYHVAFQGHDSRLYTAGDAGVKAWELWLAPNTSPSIAALAGGGYQVAFQGHDSRLYTAGDAGVKAWELWLAPNTSPSIDS